MDSVTTILSTLDGAIVTAGQDYFEATAGAIAPIATAMPPSDMMLALMPW